MTMMIFPEATHTTQHTHTTHTVHKIHKSKVHKQTRTLGGQPGTLTHTARPRQQTFYDRLGQPPFWRQVTGPTRSIKYEAGVVYIYIYIYM